MPIADFLGLMPDTVTWEAVATRDVYGKPATYANAVSYRARVSYSQKRIPSRATGQDVVASCQVWLNGVLAALNTDDRITLPDGSTPVIVGWDTPTNDKGTHHTKIYMGPV